ncbi:MAG: PD40 domain-containing protein [Bacteroidia bacterium]|nr:PD40 domain-containing protein [Bacteroidia bacterium]
MKKNLLLLIGILFISGIVFSASIESHTLSMPAKGDGKSKIKMGQAWLKFNDGDYYGALRIYRKIYDSIPDDPEVNFRIGQCYIALKQINNALPHLQKANQKDSLIDKELPFLLGQALQFSGKIDAAMSCYYKFKSTLKPRQLEHHHVNVLLMQCQTAKEMMSKPVDVKIKNIGQSVNSKYTDANPSITADGKTFIFTSRRPNAKGDNIDPNTDDYYDDVYISKWEDAAKTWAQATPISGQINTEGYDADLSISPDGNKIFLYKNIPGETQSGDIYISDKQPDGTWGKPNPLGKNINSTYFESSACVTADGNTLYFVSEREGFGIESYGMGDIYMAKSEGSDWGKPVNLGSLINTVDDEIGVFIHPDGKTLFFSSNGHNTMGGHDIFMSTLQDGKWTTPVNLGYPINTTKEEIHFILSMDGKKAYISSNRDGGMGGYDIWEVDMTNYYKSLNKDLANSLSGPVLSIIKGTVIDGESKPVQTEIIFKDESNSETKVKTNEKGEYFVTLPAEKKYELIIDNENFMQFKFSFKLPGSKTETFTMTKHIILKKK